MLILRFLAEVLCLILEISLAMHQSQKSAITETFQLNEYWHCLSNSESAHGLELDSLHLKVLPAANRTIFHTNELNHACTQQLAAVKCWIPYSRMKSLGLVFMFYVLVGQVCLTGLELLCELKRSFSKNNNREEEIRRNQ